VTRKDRKNDEPVAATGADMSDKKRKRKRDTQASSDKRPPKLRSLASEPRGRKGKAKKRRKREAADEQTSLPIAPAAADAPATADSVAPADRPDTMPAAPSHPVGHGATTIPLAPERPSAPAPGTTTLPVTLDPSSARYAAVTPLPVLSQRKLDAEGESYELTADGYELTADGDDLEASSADVPELGIGGRVVAPHVRFEDDALENFRPTAIPSGDVAAQIRALEARLDGLIQGAARSDPHASLGPLPVEGTDAEGEREPVQSAESIAVESAAELADSRYFVEKWGRKGLRSRAEEVDEFGLDRSFETRLRPVLDFIYQRYFRIQTEGITNVPSEGRAVVVGNHSGSIPIDGLMLRTALRLDHPASRDLRWLAEDFLFYLPFAGVFMNRAGAVRACQENAERLLSRDNLIAVFPEGVQGIRKLFRDRYRLQRFGRGGYIRLCLRTRAPLIPCAIIGGEESSPLLYRFDAIADLLRVPYLPVTPTFPALGALGLVPAPTKWRIKFGEPIAFDNYGPEAADDDLLVGRLSDRVRSTIQSMLDSGLQKRKSIWF
jgi:1-acyl-sn-glycerol-3-phosphate acyltransferase